jgi:hypothetical protein
MINNNVADQERAALALIKPTYRWEQQEMR